jgi:hypothetical protein
MPPRSDNYAATRPAVSTPAQPHSRGPGLPDVAIDTFVGYGCLLNSTITSGSGHAAGSDFPGGWVQWPCPFAAEVHTLPAVVVAVAGSSRYVVAAP